MRGFVVRKSYRVDAPQGAFTAAVYLEWIPAERRHAFLANGCQEATVYPQALADALAHEQAAQATEPCADVRVLQVERAPHAWIYPGMYSALADEYLTEDERDVLALKD